MMSYYYVKSGAGLYGVPDDSVERFAAFKAAVLLAEGKIEPYDEDRHGRRAGAPPSTKEAKAVRTK